MTHKIPFRVFHPITHGQDLSWGQPQKNPLSKGRLSFRMHTHTLTQKSLSPVTPSRKRHLSLGFKRCGRDWDHLTITLNDPLGEFILLVPVTLDLVVWEVLLSKGVQSYIKGAMNMLCPGSSRGEESLSKWEELTWSAVLAKAAVAWWRREDYEKTSDAQLALSGGPCPVMSAGPASSGQRREWFPGFRPLRD